MDSIPHVMYMIYGYAVPVVILAVLYGFRWKVGMWGNCLSLGAVLFSILVAVGWWEDVACLLAQQAPVVLFLADCMAIWGIFLVTLLILDALTRTMSTIKVKYADIVENIGNGIVLFLLFLALYGFFLFAEDVGPVGENHGVETPGDSMAIQMFRYLSDGNLAGFTGVSQFDSDGKFRELHLKRRQALMYNALEGSIQGKEEQATAAAKRRN